MTDITAWQEAARTALARVSGYGRYGGPPAVRHSRASIGKDGLHRTDLVLRVRDGHDVPMRVLWPETAQGAKLPVMICLQDRASGMHVSWGESYKPSDTAAIADGYDFAVQAVDRGYAAVCIELPGVGIRQEPAGGRSEAEIFISALYTGRCPLADAASEVSVAVNWLALGQAEFAVDHGNIFVAARGFGGIAAVLAVALDDRLAGTFVVDCLAQARELLKTTPPPLEFVLPGLLQWMDMEDVVALCAPRPFLAVAGRHHPVWPVSRAVQVVEAARPVYAGLGAGDRLTAIPSADAGGIDPEAVWNEFQRLRRVALEKGAG